MSELPVQTAVDLSTFQLGKIEKLEAEMLMIPQVTTLLTHHFAPGVYLREIEMPAGAFIIGHEHKTEHLNIVLSGKAIVMAEGVIHHIEAPYIFKSNAGVRKVLYIIETMRWATVHPTDETNIEVLYGVLVQESGAFIEHASLMLEMEAKLKNGQ